MATVKRGDPNLCQARTTGQVPSTYNYEPFKQASDYIGAKCLSATPTKDTLKKQPIVIISERFHCPDVCILYFAQICSLDRQIVQAAEQVFELQ